jgi:hypothetical protein
MKKLFIIIFIFMAFLFIPTSAHAQDGYVFNEDVTDDWTSETIVSDHQMVFDYHPTELPAEGFISINIHAPGNPSDTEFYHSYSNGSFTSGISVYLRNIGNIKYDWVDVEKWWNRYNEPGTDGNIPNLLDMGEIWVTWDFIEYLAGISGGVLEGFKIELAQVSVTDIENRVDAFHAHTPISTISYGGMKVNVWAYDTLIQSSIHSIGQTVDLPADPPVNPGEKFQGYVGLITWTDDVGAIQATNTLFLNPDWVSQDDLTLDKYTVNLYARYVPVGSFEGVDTPSNAPTAIIELLDSFGLNNVFGYLASYMAIMLGNVVYLAYSRAPIYSYAIVLLAVTGLWTWFGFLPIWAVILMFSVAGLMIAYSLHDRGDR